MLPAPSSPLLLRRLPFAELPSGSSSSSRSQLSDLAAAAGLPCVARLPPPASGPQGVPASLAWLTRPAAAVPAAAGLGSGGAAGAAAGAALATAVGAAAEAPNRLLLAARDAPANAAASALLPLAAAALACAPSTDAGASGVVARLPVSAVFVLLGMATAASCLLSALLLLGCPCSCGLAFGFVRLSVAIACSCFRKLRSVLVASTAALRVGETEATGGVLGTASSEVVRRLGMLVGPLLMEGGANPAKKSSSLTDAMLLLATTLDVASSAYKQW